MRSFILMLSFFTRLPLPQTLYEESLYIKGIKYVPFIGLLMGFMLYGISFLSLILDKQVVAVVLMLAYIMLTGALHLDGLADTCDGVFSGRNRQRILEIMRDSHIGVYGVISIGFWLLIYSILLSRIPYEALIVLPIAGKSAAIISASLAKYVRDEGLGKIFAENAKGPALFFAIAIPVLAVILIDPFYSIGLGFSFIAVVLATGWFKKILGGITGDTMGFVCEISQMVFLFTVYLTVALKQVF